MYKLIIARKGACSLKCTDNIHCRNTQIYQNKSNGKEQEVYRKSMGKCLQMGKSGVDVVAKLRQGEGEGGEYKQREKMNKKERTNI